MPKTVAPIVMIAIGVCCVIAGWILQHQLSYWQWRGGFMILAGAVLIGFGLTKAVRGRTRVR